MYVFISFVCEITFVFCIHESRRTEMNQNILDYIDKEWNSNDKFSHPQYDTEANVTIDLPEPVEPVINSTIDTEDKDKDAKLATYQLTKYSLDIFKQMANRSFEASGLTLQDLNYYEGNRNEFVIKWYLKEMNNTRGDIFLTKVVGNITREVRGRELNNLIIELLNRMFTSNATQAPATERTEHQRQQTHADDTLRIWKQHQHPPKRPQKHTFQLERPKNMKIDINKLNATNMEHVMLKKIKENFKNKNYGDPFINLSDIERPGHPGPQFPGRQFPEDPSLDPSVYPHPDEYPRIPGRPGSVKPPGFPGSRPHHGMMYPPPKPGEFGAFPSPEEMGIELRPGEPGYTGTPGVPGPDPGPGWVPPIVFPVSTGLTPRPLPGELPKPTLALPPSVHGDPSRPFGSLLQQNPRPVITTEDPFLAGLLQDMKTHQAGYLSHFTIKFCELIATKRKEDATPLIHTLEPTFERLYDQQQLFTFGEPLTTKLLDIVRLVNAGPTDVVQSQAGMLHYALTNRNMYFSADISALIEYADSLYNDQEGQQLLKTLHDVKLFPNTTKTATQLGTEMFDVALLAPYRRMTGTQKLQVLFDNINTAIIKRFPAIRRAVEKERRGKGGEIKGGVDSGQSSYNNYKSYRHIINRESMHKRKDKNIKNKRKIRTRNTNINQDIGNYERILRQNSKKHLSKIKSDETMSIDDRIIKEIKMNSTKNIRHKNHYKIKTNPKNINTMENKRDYKKKVNERRKKSNTSFKRTAKYNSDYSVEERDFKTKVNDALLHWDTVQNVVLRDGRNVVTPKNKMNYFSSYSDEEGVLKTNIYKVFNDVLNE